MSAGGSSRLWPLTRLGTVAASHTTVDFYPAFFPALLGLLEVRCDLTARQTALILGSVSITSGLSQPVAAWLSDRLDSRVFGGAGLLLAAVCLSCIGLANDAWSLVAILTVGMIGVGVFHPIGASSMGQLSGSRRSVGISVFFVAGMAGGVAGSLLAPRIVGSAGFEWLRWMMVPGVIMAILLHLAIARAPHRQTDHGAMTFEPTDLSARWFAMGLLYVSSGLRFMVNIALVYLLLRWAQAPFYIENPTWSDRQVAEAAAGIVGNLNAMVVLGMALGGLGAGVLIRQGREKWPVVLVPVIGAPAIGLLGHASLWGGYLLAVASGMAFAALIPITLSLAQRLLPHRTALASGLVLGGAWAMGCLGSAGAQFLLSRGMSITQTLWVTAGVLVLAGLVCVPLRVR